MNRFQVGVGVLVTISAFTRVASAQTLEAKCKTIAERIVASEGMGNFDNPAPGIVKNIDEKGNVRFLRKTNPGNLSYLEIDGEKIEKAVTVSNEQVVVTTCGIGMSLGIGMARLDRCAPSVTIIITFDQACTVNRVTEDFDSGQMDQAPFSNILSADQAQCTSDRIYLDSLPKPSQFLPNPGGSRPYLGYFPLPPPNDPMSIMRRTFICEQYFPRVP